MSSKYLHDFTLQHTQPQLRRQYLQKLIHEIERLYKDENSSPIMKNIIIMVLKPQANIHIYYDHNTVDEYVPLSAFN